MNMREKIARALAALEFERDQGVPMPADFGALEYQWQDWAHEADAALAAMREPTEEMLRHGCEAGLSTATLLDDTRFACERAVWSAMINAAGDAG